MRCNPLRWLLGGVLIIGLLGVMTLQGVLAQIETELEQRTQAALDQAGLGWAQIGFAGRDAKLAGKAADEREQRQAFEITHSIWGVRTVKNRTELVEEQKNYVWRALLRENRLRLTGFVPNEVTRKAIIGAAKATFPQLEIEDRMKLARGAPETEVWLGAVSFGLKQLSGLKAGARVELDSDGLAVAGEAEDFATYRTIKSALATSLPQGVTLKSNGVVPPVVKPYIWAARLSSTELQLGGFVPSERAREDVFAAAQKAFAHRTIVDRMRIASGEPENLMAAAVGALEKLAQLEEGSIELKEDQLVLAGLAAKEETAEALRNALRDGIPEGIKVTEQIKFREPTIKPVSPYTIAAAIDDDAMSLSGYVPSEPARKALIEAAASRFPKLKISDRLQLGAGAPEGWQACMIAGLGGLNKLNNGHIRMHDRTLQFAAVTDDEQVAEAIRNELKAAANRACELDFKIVVNVPPEPELNWRAVAADGEIRLEGEVPDEATKSDLALVAAKLFPNSRLVDRTEIKAGSSKKWPKVTETGLRMLARLRSGEVRLSGLELSVSGQAPDTAVATVVRQQLRDLPKGYKGGDTVEVRSDAMIWAEQEAKRKAEAEARRKQEEETARRKAEEEAARHAAEEEARRKRDAEIRQRAEEEQARRAAAAAAEAARKAAAEARAAEEARIAAEARAAEEARAAAAAEQARIAEEARAAAEARRAAEEAARAKADVQPPPEAQQERHAALASEERTEVDRCQERIAAAQHRSINFDRASHVLDDDGLEALSHLAEVATACPQMELEIAGHADAEGTPDRNQTLSERRAEAAGEYLISKGIPSQRIKTVGYGATRPLSPNDTPDGRAANRRVEIIAKDR